jgi:hypothetical protein
LGAFVRQEAGEAPPLRPFIADSRLVQGKPYKPNQSSRKIQKSQKTPRKPRFSPVSAQKKRVNTLISLKTWGLFGHMSTFVNIGLIYCFVSIG